MSKDLERRIAKMEAVEAIRQLASRYGLGIDSRNIDMVVDLFVDDGRPVFFRSVTGVPGGNELRDSYYVAQSRYTSSQHFMCNHVIDVDDDTHAHGIVYALVYQRSGETGTWTVLAMQYWDKYERIGDRWLFAERRPHGWWMTEWNVPPPPREASPDSLPHAFPSWQEFWRRVASTT